MALRNPYSEYSRTGDEDRLDRDALIRAMEPEPPPRPRTPSRTPQQTREMLSGPGGRTQYMDPQEAADIGQNAFTGDRWQDERPEPDTGLAAPSTPPQTPAHQYNPQRGFGLIDAYDDPYTRRMEGSPSVGGNAATYAQIGGSIVPGWGHVIGGLGGAIGALFAKNAPTAMTDFRIEDARQMISQAHEDAFGRPIDPAYLDQIIRGQGWEDGDRWMGQDSLAYVLDQFAQQAPGERAAADAAATPPATPAAPAGTSAPGRYAMEGFDLQRAQDPSFSAKDAFAAAAQAAPEPPPGEDKAALGTWFAQHVQPSMEAQGFTVNWVEGDKINVTGPQGTGTIDWYRGAGAPGGALAWQAEGGAGIAGGAENAQAAYDQLAGSINPNAPQAEMESAIAAAFGHLPGYGGAYKESVMLNGQWYDLVRGYGAEGAEFQGLVPKTDGGGGSGAPSGGGTGTGLNLAPGVSLAAPLGNSDVYAQIQAAIQRLMSGASTREELLEALG